MKHIVTETIPDCPICNQELCLVKWYSEKPTDNHPYGTEPRWRWECFNCHYKSKELKEMPSYRTEEIVR